MININTTKWPLICLSSAFLIACDPEFDNPVGDTSSYSNGEADFSNYVSVGDSLTAGYADSALYISGQENSFPNILATQFKTVGGGAFTQPLMDDNLGGLLFGGTADPDFANRLVLNTTDPSKPSPEPIAGTPTNEIVIGAPTLSGTFNNMGVPGAKSFHLGSPGYGSAAGLAGGTANPYFVRFASTTTTTVITDAATQAPTFFSLWTGNNDVLSYATSGGIGVDQTGNSNPTTYGGNDLTDPTFFAGTYAGLVGALTANPATKGILINIPDVSTIPYFTRVQYNSVPLDSANATALQSGFDAAYNPGLDAALASGLFPSLTQAEVNKRKINFTAGLTNSPIIDASEEVADSTLTDLSLAGIPAIRQANSSDLITLTSATILGTDNTGPTDKWGLSPTSPLGDQYVLTPAEITAIDTVRTALNTTIKATADANNNLAFFDSAAFMANLKSTGIDYGTGNLASTYATGGAFSLDGVHPTARGYAALANEIIDTINTTFNATVPRTDPGTFTTIFLK